MMILIVGSQDAPNCDLLLFDPNKLREHRLKEHKSVYLEKNCSSPGSIGKLYFEFILERMNLLLSLTVLLLA